MSKKLAIPFKSTPAPSSKLRVMNTNHILKRLLIAALLVSGVAQASDNAIRVSDEAGQRVARFTVGDSRCVLKDDQVRCTPVSK